LLVIGNSKAKVLPLSVYPDILDARLDNFFREDETALVEYLIQPRREKARAKVASITLKVIETKIRRATLLDDKDVQVSIETSGFPEQMDGEERTSRPAPNNSNAIIVLEVS
jgi:hypothetical protein